MGRTPSRGEKPPISVDPALRPVKEDPWAKVTPLRSVTGLRSSRPCARWCSSGRACRSGSPSCRGPSRGRGRCGCGSRPARSAAPISTSSTATCPTRSCRSFPATRSSAGSRRAAAAPTPFSDRRARRRALARLDLRRVRVLPARTRRTSATGRVFTGYTRDGGFADACRRRRALLLPDARGLRRLQRRAAALRGADRLPRAAPGGRRPSGSASTASAPPRTSSRQVAVHQGRAVFAFTRTGDARGAGLRARARRRSGRGARRRRRRSRSTPRSSSRPSARWCRPRSRAVRKGGVVVCAGIHMSDIPAFPYERLWGERVAALGRQPHPPRRRGVPAARRRDPAAHRGRALTRSSAPATRSPPCARGACAARRCSCPDAAEGGRFGGIVTAAILPFPGGFMRRASLLPALVVLGFFTALPVRSAEPPRLFRQPTISADAVVFVFADDLWIVARDGGEARRLTASVGIESHPLFSPDGATVAFTGEYDGNLDVYIVPAAGGEPRRLTWHPGDDQLLAWSADGARGPLSLRARERHRTTPISSPSPPPAAGRSGCRCPRSGWPRLRPTASASPTCRTAQWQLAWKRYRGGQTTPIWLVDLATLAVEKIPRDNSNDAWPMWVGRRGLLPLRPRRRRWRSIATTRPTAR